MFLASSPAGSWCPLAGGCIAPVCVSVVTWPFPLCASVCLLLKDIRGFRARSDLI